MTKNKLRLDQLLVDRDLVESRNKAQALIRAGKVLVSDTVIDKPGTSVKIDAAIRIKDIMQFVSRGGLKLEGAMKHFKIDPFGWICVDLGASTGGFTDCLCQRGAKKIYAIDVGYGQLAWKLRQDSRVIVMERCNARHLQSLPDPIDFIVGDLSFISISKIIDAMLRLVKSKAKGVLLIKPQFEVGPEGIKDGLVKSEQLREQAIQTVLQDFKQAGCIILGHIPSPIAGAKKGNIEELVYVEFPA